MSVPAGFKATEAGVIPDDWDVQRLADLFSISAGGDYDPKIASPIYTSRYRYPVYANALKPNAVHSFASEHRHPAKSVTVTARGMVGVAAYRDHPFTAIGRLLVLQPHSGNDGRFFSEFINQRVEFAVESTGVPQLTAPQIGSYFVAVPGCAEQAKIAEALSDMDEAIAAQEAVIAKKRALKTATMQALLTGTRRLPGFSGGWERRSFDQLFQFLRNGSAPRSALSANGAIGYIHYGDIHANPRPHMDCGKGALPRIAREVVSRLPRVQDGDLLIADASEDYDGTGKSVEAANIGDDEVVAGLHTLLLRPVEKMAPGFAGHLQFIPEVKRQYVAAAQGVSVYGLSRSAVKSVEVALPKYDEQAAISSCLMDMEIDLSHQQDTLKKLCDLKVGMVQQLLTGKTRLV